MIIPIVEGEGEVRAVPVLLWRLISALGCSIPVAREPMRQKRTEVVRERDFKTKITQARAKNAIAVLVLFDLDDDCARNIVPKLRAWAAETASDIPCAVVLARREYEAWFLGAIESLQGKQRVFTDATYVGEPEEKRGAKEALRRLMPKDTPYDPVADQAALSKMFSLEQAYRRCSSFRKLVKELCRLLTQLGQRPTIPSSWSEAIL